MYPEPNPSIQFVEDFWQKLLESASTANLSGKSPRIQRITVAGPAIPKLHIFLWSLNGSIPRH
jgi:hypothetical protein